jgi:hypothetical protein
MQAYPKVMRSFYLLINVLFHNHPGTMLELDTPILVQIISATREGLTSLSNHTAIATQCCDTLDHMLVFLVENKTKDSPPMRSFANHVGQHPEMLPGLLEMMMQVLLFDENMNLWSLARPLLCLILLIPGESLAVISNSVHAILSVEYAHQLLLFFVICQSLVLCCLNSVSSIIITWVI